MRVVVAHHQHVRGYTVRARVAPRHHARRVDARDRRIDRMMVVEGNPLGDERRKVGHKGGRYLRGLQAVEGDN